MNEIFDKLLIRIILCLLTFGILFSYRYLHFLLFKKIKKLTMRSIYPEKNLAHAIFIAARLIGFVIIINAQIIDLSNGLFFAISSLIINSVISILLFLASTYVFESIVLYNFTAEDEVIRRQNLSFAVVNSGLSICAALILTTINKVAGESLINLLFLWLFSLVIFGGSTKLFNLVFKINLSRSIVQHHLPTSFHYIGFISSWVIVISTVIDHPIINYQRYILKTLIDLVLNIIIFPLFFIGINYVFYIKKLQNIKDKEVKEISNFGTFEGILLFISALLTVMITSNIKFGTFYPTL
jgi:hypothetical protein